MKFLVCFLEGFILSFLLTALYVKFFDVYFGYASIIILYGVWIVLMVYFIVRGIFNQLNKNTPIITLADKIFLGIALILAIIFVLSRLDQVWGNFNYILQNKSLI